MASSIEADVLRKPLPDNEPIDDTVGSTALEKPLPAGSPDPTNNLDWNALRQESLKPGGFGSRRASLWPRLLGVEDEGADSQEPSTHAVSNAEEHPDERQIKLDTDRSFVLYPVEPRDDRETLQESLHELLIALFRKRRKLGYFQGYHDIITVIYLTVPPRLRFSCAEKMSLHRVRDSMGSGLEPVLGLLRITRNLLRLADKPFTETLERNSPLPFYALSNLLTLFSHDMPTLSLIQHVFDYLLSRPPIAVVYLTAVAILSRKEEVLALELEGEEGMAHSLLSTLPDLVDEEEEEAEEHREDVIIEAIAPSPTEEQPSQQSLSPVMETDSAPSDVAPPTSESSPQDLDPLLSRARKRHVSDALLCGTSKSRSRSTHRGRDHQGSSSTAADAPIPSLPHTSPLHSRSSSQVKSPPSPPPPPAYMSEIEKMHTNKPTISLSSLLIQADELRQRFPPDHPELALDKVMGPQSVIFTWKEPDATDNILDGLDTMDPDDEAEAILLHPELIVYPYDPASEVEDSKEGAEVVDDDDGYDSEGKQGGKRKRRKLVKPRRQLDVKTKTIVTGAVIVLAVAMAAYGIRAGNGGGIFHRLGVVGQGHKKSHHWLGGALAGAAVKFAHLFGGENGRG